MNCKMCDSLVNFLKSIDSPSFICFYVSFNVYTGKLSDKRRVFSWERCSWLISTFLWRVPSTWEYEASSSPTHLSITSFSQLGITDKVHISIDWEEEYYFFSGKSFWAFALEGPRRKRTTLPWRLMSWTPRTNRPNRLRCFKVSCNLIIGVKPSVQRETNQFCPNR